MIKKIIGLFLLACIVSSSTGCLSTLAYQNSKKKVAMRKAIISGDQRAIKAVKLGSDGVGIGVDISAWEVLKEQPLVQGAAALGDAGIIYGLYEGVKYIDDNIGDDSGGSSGSKGGGGNTSGNDSIVINGNGNTINTGSSDGLGEGRTGDPVIIDQP